MCEQVFCSYCYVQITIVYYFLNEVIVLQVSEKSGFVQFFKNLSLLHDSHLKITRLLSALRSSSSSKQFFSYLKRNLK